MKFDPARFASIRAREQKEEPVVKSDLDMLRDHERPVRGRYHADPEGYGRQHPSRDCCCRRSEKSRLRSRLIRHEQEADERREIDEQRRLEDEAETAEMLKSFSKSQPNDFEFKVDDQAKKNAAADMAASERV